jgi:hypothetical protein
MAVVVFFSVFEQSSRKLLFCSDIIANISTSPVSAFIQAIRCKPLLIRFEFPLTLKSE